MAGAPFVGRSPGPAARWHRSPRVVLDAPRYRPDMARGTVGHAAPHLIERDDQLALLDAAWRDAEHGTGSTVVIRGEAGIGKSVLLRRFVDSVEPGALTGIGYCDAVSTPRPFSPLYDLVSALGTGLADRLRDRATRGGIQDWLLERLNAASCVLAIEDLQWADEATVDLVRLLVRRMPESRSLFLLTLRDDASAPSAVRSLLGHLATAQGIHHVALAPLSEAAVARMAEGRAIDPRRLHRLTGGNPFFASEVIAGGGSDIPATVRDLLGSRLVELRPRARRALEAAAILGTRVEPWLLAAVTGEDLPGIDDAVAAGLVGREAAEYAFRHELTRIAVLDGTPAIRAIALHRRALEALGLGSVGDAARLAHHAEGAGDGGAVLEHAVAAAHQALQTGAYREGIAQLERALRFADDEAQRADLLELLGNAFMDIARGSEADRAWMAALEIRRRREDEPRRIGDLLRRIGRAAWWQADGRRARRLAQEAIATLEPLGETHELAMAYSHWSAQLMVSDENEEAIAWGRRAMDLADRLGLDDVRAHALNNIGSAELVMGDESGFEKVERSLEISRRIGRGDYVCRALMNLASGASTTHQLHRADRWFTELAEYGEASEVRSCNVDASRCEVLLQLGRWDEAEAAAHRALALTGDLTVDPLDQSSAYGVLARLAARRGDARATELAERAHDVVRGAMQLPLEWGAVRAMTEIAWIAGDLTRLVPDLRSLLDRSRAVRDPWIAGDVARWLRLANEPVPTDTSMARPYRLEVIGEWTAAARLWDRIEDPYEAAFARLHTDNPSEVRAAHDALVRLGAVAVIPMARRRLADLGAPLPRGPRRTTESHPAGLTVREAEIADLMADGLSNPEIARRLVLSEKTVGHHASAVLAKLSVRRRAEVARAMSRYAGSVMDRQ